MLRLSFLRAAKDIKRIIIIVVVSCVFRIDLFSLRLILKPLGVLFQMEIKTDFNLLNDIFEMNILFAFYVSHSKEAA